LILTGQRIACWVTTSQYEKARVTGTGDQPLREEVSVTRSIAAEFESGSLLRKRNHQCVEIPTFDPITISAYLSISSLDILSPRLTLSPRLVTGATDDRPKQLGGLLDPAGLRKLFKEEKETILPAQYGLLIWNVAAV